MNQQIESNLLDAWLNMSSCIRGNRLVNSMPFKEIVICNILFKEQQENVYSLTATNLCEKTKLLKSQMNQLLNSLENKNMIKRIPSKEDKRKLYICLTPHGIASYLQEHEQILNLLTKLKLTLGEEKAINLTSLLNQATSIMTSIQ